MEEYEKACHIGVLSTLLTKAFVYDSLLHRLVCRVMACIGRHVDNGPWDLEDHPSA